jgi:hypothetical protein
MRQVTQRYKNMTLFLGTWIEGWKIYCRIQFCWTHEFTTNCILCFACWWVAVWNPFIIDIKPGQFSSWTIHIIQYFSYIINKNRSLFLWKWIKGWLTYGKVQGLVRMEFIMSPSNNLRSIIYLQVRQYSVHLTCFSVRIGRGGCPSCDLCLWRKRIYIYINLYIYLLFLMLNN